MKSSFRSDVFVSETPTENGKANNTTNNFISNNNHRNSETPQQQQKTDNNNNNNKCTNLISKKSKTSLPGKQNIDSKMYKKNKLSAFHDLHIKSHSNVSILYADIVNFTPLAYKFEPPELVNILNKLFAKFDQKAKVQYFQLDSRVFLHSNFKLDF